MGRGSSKANSGASKYDTSYGKATVASGIKAGDVLIDKILDKDTSSEKRTRWNFQLGVGKSSEYVYSDLIVKDVKVGAKTTKVTALFDRAITKRYGTAEFGKDYIEVTKTFKNDDVVWKRKKG